MTSSPGIFDQEITAQPCKPSCRAHVHAPDLPSGYRGPDALELGADKPRGWTAQGGPAPEPDMNYLWFQCNVCDELVREDDVRRHRCA